MQAQRGVEGSKQKHQSCSCVLLAPSQVETIGRAVPSLPLELNRRQRHAAVHPPFCPDLARRSEIPYVALYSCEATILRKIQAKKSTQPVGSQVTIPWLQGTLLSRSRPRSAGPTVQRLLGCSNSWTDEIWYSHYSRILISGRLGPCIGAFCSVVERPACFSRNVYLRPRSAARVVLFYITALPA